MNAKNGEDSQYEEKNARMEQGREERMEEEERRGGEANVESPLAGKGQTESRNGLVKKGKKGRNKKTN